MPPHGFHSVRFRTGLRSSFFFEPRASPGSPPDRSAVFVFWPEGSPKAPRRLPDSPRPAPSSPGGPRRGWESAVGKVVLAERCKDTLRTRAVVGSSPAGPKQG